MILQITDAVASCIAVSVPALLFLTALFIAVSVSTGIITYRIRTKSHRSGSVNGEDSNDKDENDS